ncbi:DUF2306 domain-containing protein [Ferrimonas senticii]|uniref:DUF2306 domain-containing protein n=1 Tax=Ferrimonas senticii TaxID=394566 RepID=UPI000487B9AD|nr:DUF2306 domain-containing protein [Ferrimonas senticii]
MDEFINGPLGAFHVVSAIIALVIGAVVLASKKGTNKHKKLGYVYFFSMLVLNLSAIPITSMSGSIGLFHIFILLSLPTTIMALYIPLFWRHKTNWLVLHFSFMYWSYVGLIAAFVAEIMVRLPTILMTTRQSDAQNISYTGYVDVALAFAIMGLVMFFAELIFRSWRKRLKVG